MSRFSFEPRVANGRVGFSLGGGLLGLRRDEIDQHAGLPSVFSESDHDGRRDPLRAIEPSEVRYRYSEEFGGLGAIENAIAIERSRQVGLRLLLVARGRRRGGRARIRVVWRLIVFSILTNQPRGCGVSSGSKLCGAKQRCEGIKG
jgi:hypothetical protein